MISSIYCFWPYSHAACIVRRSALTEHLRVDGARAARFIAAAAMAIAALCSSAAGQVVRPDVAQIAPIEQANARVPAAQAFDALQPKAGSWQVVDNVLTQSDQSAMYARSYIQGPKWVDCIIQATLQVDSIDPVGASNGVRVIVRGDAETDTFYTVGLWAGSHEVRIEKARGLVFETLTCNQIGTLAAAPFPVELGKPYQVTVVADRATIYCFIDGRFVVLGQEADFTTLPAGQVGFFTSRACGSYRQVSIRGMHGITKSPVTSYPGNPLNVATYSPAVVKDDRFRMWDGMGRYAESDDGITWTRPHGIEPVVTWANKGDWPTGNNCGDPDVLKIDGEYWITFWSTCNRRNGAFDGLGLERSADGVHWIPEPANPVFYMGPYGDWDELVVGDHALIRDGNLFKLWHVGITRWQRGFRNEFGYAESSDGRSWRKCRLNPVLTQGEPGTWDGGWVYAAGVVKIDDEQNATHVYAGQPGASYHLFYTGQPTNNELICGVKRIGYAFSLDGVHWVKWDDPTTTEPPFHRSDPVVNWAEYGRLGYLGAGACTAVLLDDEVRIYHSMYDERPDIPRTDGVIGTGYATIQVDTLRQIVADAKARGLLSCASRQEIEATLDAPLPQSMWDDLQGHVLAAIQAKQAGNADSEKEARTQIATIRCKFTKALEAYYEQTMAPLKEVIDRLEAGDVVTEKVLWNLPLERTGTVGTQVELTDLRMPPTAHPVMIEIEANCNRFDIARLAWASDKGFQAGQEREFIVGYLGPESPTYRVTISPTGQPITVLRLQFPGGSTVKLKDVRIRELGW